MLVAIGAVAVGLSACGGSDGGGADKTEAAQPAPTAPAVSGAAPSRTTKKRYIARADRVCLAARARLTPIRSKVTAASKNADPTLVYRQYAVLTARAADVYSGALAQIQALDSPPGDQAQIDRLNSLFGQTATITRQISSAASAQDGQQIKDLSAQLTALADRYRAAAKAYGLRQCGQTAGAALNRRGNR